MNKKNILINVAVLITIAAGVSFLVNTIRNKTYPKTSNFPFYPINEIGLMKVLGCFSNQYLVN